MKINRITFLAFLVIFFYSCNVDMGEKGDGNVITEQMDVANFEKISMHGAFEVVLRKSTQAGVTIVTDANLMDYIDVNVSGNTLEINSRERLRPSDGVQVIIDYLTLEELEVAGAAEVRAEELIRGEELFLDMSGAGDIELEVELKELDIEVSGAGSVRLSGKTLEQDVRMSGAGSYSARDLISERCKIEISGVGGAEVYAVEVLDAQVSGVGGVEYFGNPADVKTNVSGLGSIEAGKE